MPDIELYGATYSDVPAVDLPKSGGGTARFYDPTSILQSYVDTTGANYTIGNDNYVAINYPTGLNGNNVVSIGLAQWTTNSGPFSIFPYGTVHGVWYLVGPAGTTINGARFRYWYISS